ncbi:MAG: TIGR01244 family sulfur transferase [Rhizobiaceae bacterium]
MEFRPVTEDFAVAPQIEASDVAGIKAAGFKSLVCNRPDTEMGAVAHDGIADAARAAGLEFRFIPVVSGSITQQNVADMKEALSSLPRPVLAYCRTGGRCMNLFMLVQQA